MKRIFYVFMVLFLWLGTGANSLYGQNALNFDGTNDFVNCGNAASLQLSTGTIEAWVKTSNAGAGFRGIVVKNSAYGLFMNDNVLIGYSWGSTGIMTTSISLNDNVWHHVAMSFQSGVTNGTRIYIDGVLRATSLLTVQAQTMGLTIGAGSTSGGQNFTGVIEDVRIWSTVRTATEIANNRSCELVGTETGLVSYYKMNQGTADGTNTGITTLTDTKNANNGTLTNFALTGSTSNWVTSTALSSVSIAASATSIAYGTSVTFTATASGGTSPTYQWKRNGTNVGTNSNTYTNATLDNNDIITCVVTSTSTCGTSLSATSNSVTMTVVAPTPNALHFDGTNDYVTLPNINPISSGTAGQYTVETWLKLQSYNSATTWIYGDEAAGNGGIIMQIDASGYIWTYRAAVGVVTSTAQVPLNTWTHIAFVQDASNLKLYVNGVFIQNLLSGANLHIETNTAPTIGTTGGSRMLNGTLDEMRIWNKALSQSDIESRMNCELSGSESGLVAYYRFNQGIAAGTNTGLTTLTDATANANNGTLSNFALTGATSNWVTSGISTTVTPSVSIAASTSGTISPTTSVTFTATPTNGGGSPTYQWKKNGTDVGTNSATYTNATWANNDIVTCVLTSSISCASPTTATSNAVTLSVATTVTPSVSIAVVAGNLTGCNNSYIAFRATPTNGGTTPSYQWKKNNVNVGTNSTDFTDNVWATNDVITCVMTSNAVNASPTTATSNSLTTTVVPTAGITGATTGCGSVTLTGTGGTNYNWSSGQISATSATFTTSGTYTVTVTGSGCSATASAVVTVNPLPSVTLSNTGANSVVGTAVLSVNSTTASDIKWYNSATLTNTSAFIASGTTVAGGNGAGSATNQINYAYDIYVDGSGNMYIADGDNYRIQKWAVGATTGTTVAGGNGFGSGANQFRAFGIYVDGSGNIYIADRDNNRIQKWAAGATSGTTVAGGNGQGSAANQFFYSNSVHVTASGDMYIADLINNRIQKWAAGATSGTTVAGGNGQGSAANQLNYPTSVYLTASGDMYIADRANHRIQKWSAGATSGTTVAGGNGQGSAANQLNYPTSVYLTASGDMYIADGNNHRIQKWAAGATSGTTVAGGNGQGSAANQLNSPADIYVDGSGNMYIADQNNHRIQKWTQAAVNTYTPTTAGSYTAVVTVNGCSATTNAITVSSVLPVEWLSFTGYNEGAANVLNWATATEVNNKGFQVERRNAAGNDWDILGFVKAQGKEASYNFTDNTPLSMSYYRLRQIDNDGTEILSKVISVERKGNSTLKVYPNPVSDLLIVETELTSDFQILNLLRQSVLSGKTAQRIDVSALPQGAYFLKVGTEQVKFVKQ